MATPMPSPVFEKNNNTNVDYNKKSADTGSNAHHNGDMLKDRLDDNAASTIFAKNKVDCLGKRDKSSAGRIDVHAIEICSIINACDSYYTTSSCAGRCFLYTGAGIKRQQSSQYLQSSMSANNNDVTDKESRDNDQNSINNVQSFKSFTRWRVSHDLVTDPLRYFDLTTLEIDPTGGGDIIPSIGQYDYYNNNNTNNTNETRRSDMNSTVDYSNASSSTQQHATDTIVDENNKTDDYRHVNKDSPSSRLQQSTETTNQQQQLEDNSQIINMIDQSIWLRFEPFILHVACRSLADAAHLMNLARPAFKNVGLTTFSNQSSSSKYLVAIWGDEGLDMPLSTPEGLPLFDNFKHKRWLASLVNQRHERNWHKVHRFVQAARVLLDNNSSNHHDVDNNSDKKDSTNILASEVESVNKNSDKRLVVPKSFDVIGDVALLHSINTDDFNERQQIADAILRKNRAIKIACLRQSNLQGVQRAPGMDGLLQLAGPPRSMPIITTHVEYGIKCVVDLCNTFFSPRMSLERLRLCQQVARGENVLVLFAGVGMEAMQIACRTEASFITTIESNKAAVECMHKSLRMLERNKKGVLIANPTSRIKVIHGDVLQVLPTLPTNHYDRILAPRPKGDDNNNASGDLNASKSETGLHFLTALLRVIRRDRGQVHWYDFVADHEYPKCERTCNLIAKACHDETLGCEILNVSQVGSVAMRQYRVCLDFRVREKKSDKN